MMKNRKSSVAALSAATCLLIGSAAWAQQSSADRADHNAQQAAENVGDAARNAGQATENAAERAGDKVEEAAQHVADAADRDNANAGDQVSQASLPAGITAKELDDAEDLRSLLASTTEAAMTKDGLDDLVERLNDQDRNRLGNKDDLLESPPDTLNGRIAQLQKAFKDKYGKDFDIDHPDTVYSSVRLQQGEVTDGAVAMRNWPLPAETGQKNKVSPTDAAVPASNVQRPATPLGEDRIEAANLSKGREVALATLPAMKHLPPLTVSIVGEVEAWRIDIPNGIGAAKLYHNLLNHLTYLGEHTDQWPADAQQAEQLFTHHVMMALYDVDVQQNGQQQAGDSSTGSQGK